MVMEYWKQEALKRFNANYVGSMYNGTVVIGGVCFGAFFFEEFRSMPSTHLTVFTLAVGVSIVGIALLASPSVDHAENGKEQKETMLQDHGEEDLDCKGNVMQEHIELQSVCSTISVSSVSEESLDSPREEHDEISADYVASAV